MSHFYKLVILAVLIPVLVTAGTFGSRGLLHVQSASTLDEGTLDFRTNLKFYTKVADFLNEANKPENFSAVNWWLVQNNALLTYGLFNHFDITVMNRVYQDNHKPSEYNSPEDFFFDLKLGSFGLSNNRFHLGMLSSFRIPTGKDYNYPFEPYTAGSFEYGFTGLFSFFNDPYLHDRSFSLHTNLGWYYHNDGGEVLLSKDSPRNTQGVDIKADGTASEFQYGLGLTFPTELFNINLEFFGIGFIEKPDSLAYSRENFAYLTPSIKFKPKPWMSFDLGIDIRISGDENTSSKILPAANPNLNLPNYPSWKVHMGLNFRLMPVTGKEYPGEKTGIRSKVDFYENLLRERQKTRNIEDELRRLRKEREQAEKELEELRQMLEEQGK